MANRSAAFSHCVYFKLKDNSPAACAALLAGCQQYLTGHPGTLHVSAGTLADCQRPVNDRNFDVGLVIIFADRAAHDAYQVAPRHDEFIAQFRENWAQVRVFDADMSFAE